MNPDNTSVYLVSACLMGLCTRYDATIARNDECEQFLRSSVWIPFCPEQLGGLPTPRQAADIVGGDGHDVLRGTARVVTKHGEDITDHFIRGARQVLALAQAQGIDQVLLKARSPSCGVAHPTGVTAALLQHHNIHCREF